RRTPTNTRRSARSEGATRAHSAASLFPITGGSDNATSGCSRSGRVGSSNESHEYTKYFPRHVGIESGRAAFEWAGQRCDQLVGPSSEYGEEGATTAIHERLGIRLRWRE